MYYIDIIILSIIILIIVFLIYDVYKKNIKIIKKFEMYTEFDYNKLGPIKFIDKQDPLQVLGYFPNGEGEDGKLSTEQLKIIKDNGLSMATIRIPRGVRGSKGDTGTQGPKGDEGPKGEDGELFIGPPGKDGSPAPVCTNGRDAPACIPCKQGIPGNPAPSCGPADSGQPGSPARQCTPCQPGPRGDPAPACKPTPAPGTPGGAQHGNSAENCNCQCSPCNPIQCTDTVNLKKIQGDNLVINTNTNINKNINMANNKVICIGSSCITKNIIDRINNI